jgi:hypothetical protein
MLFNLARLYVGTQVAFLPVNAQEATTHAQA